MSINALSRDWHLYLFFLPATNKLVLNIYLYLKLHPPVDIKNLKFQYIFCCFESNNVLAPE